MKRKILFVLLAVFLFLFAISAYMLIDVLLEYRKADKYYTELQEEYVEIVVTPPPVVSDEGEEIQPPTEKTASAPIAVKFDKLTKKYPDVVGWIYCEDTIIHYPVVQTTDNDYYLHKDLDGNYLRSGTIFVDYRNKAVGEDQNYVIYGHDMRNDSMFGTLDNYKEQSYYDAHPVLYYLTPDGNYRIDLYAGAVVDEGDMMYQINPGEKAMEQYLQKLYKKSTFRSSVTIKPEDRIVALSTCTYEFSSARYILVGKLVPLN